MGGCLSSPKPAEGGDAYEKKQANTNGPARAASIDEIQEDFELGAQLKRVPLLAKLSDKERAKLAGALVLKVFNDREHVVTQGEKGNEFYIIKDGEAVVETAEAGEVARLKDGDYFGDTALLNEETRNATVRANRSLRCYCLESQTFQAMFGRGKLNVNFGKRKAISAEQFNPADTRGRAPEDAFREKSPEISALICQAMSDNVLFTSLDPEQMNQIVDEMWRITIETGETIIEQGDDGDNFYVVEEGNFDIFVNKEGSETWVAERGRGTSFGELALMYNSPRAATVRATSRCTVWAVDRYMFRRILMKTSENTLQQYEEFLSNVDILSGLLANERKQVAEALDEITFDQGEIVIRQGEPGDTFYIIRHGAAVVTKKEEGKLAAEVVGTLGEGDFFGERALLRNEVRAATVSAKEQLTCLYLDRDAFSMLLGPLGDLLHRKEEDYTALSPAVEEKSHFLSLDFDDLQSLGTLGKGSFGHVTLVRAPDNETYALKAVSKAQVVNLGQQDHIMSEKNVMKKLNCRFLIKLFQTFKDDQYLYLLLEVSLGGELFSILRQRTVFDEDTARFFSACVVEAFAYMHQRHIIYRDLKPENLLLDKNGYLKVTDFGFAKHVTDRTWTLCGTPDYLAPEVVSGQGHGKGVDWWTLGILIYEMLASYPPFYDEDPMKTYSKIMHGNIVFPKHFSREVVDLIQKLLHSKPTKRIGVVKGGADLIRNHAWFKSAGFSWADLNAGEMLAPIIPDISSREDLSNFEEYPDEGDEWPFYQDDGTGWDDDF